LPFRLLTSRLNEDLHSTWDRIRNFTPEYMVSLGPKVKLNLNPKLEQPPIPHDKEGGQK
jgi:hypothetical protein